MILLFAGHQHLEEMVCTAFFYAIEKILVVAQQLIHVKTRKPVFTK